jgi:hypothetical protein
MCLSCSPYVPHAPPISSCFDQFGQGVQIVMMMMMIIIIIMIMLNQKNYILKAKRIMAVEIDGVEENIRLKIGDDTEDYTNRVNGDKMDTNVIEHQKRDQESNSTGFGKVENNKHPRSEGEQNTGIS